MAEFDSNRNPLDELYSSLKEYLDLRIKEGKLSMTESLAVLFSRLIVFILAVITAAVAFAFFAFAFSLFYKLFFACAEQYANLFKRIAKRAEFV